MTTQDSDSVKAIKALDEVEKLLQDVIARVKRGACWAWQQDGVTYIDAFGFGAVTVRAGKAIEEAAPLFEVYLHALGRVPPRFKAVFEQAATLIDWIGSLEYQYGGDYHLGRGLLRLQRVESGLQGLCTQPVEAAAPAGRPSHKGKTVKDCMLLQDDEQKNELLKKLHELIDGKKGRGAALVILVCEVMGLMTKPDHAAMVKEFGNIGVRQGYNDYHSRGYKSYPQEETKGIEEHLARFKDCLK